MSTRSPCLTLVTLAEDKADRLEACRALLPPEVELDAQQEVVAAAAAEPVAQREAVEAAAEPVAQQEALEAAAEPVAQQEAVEAAVEPVAQQEAAVAEPGALQAVAMMAVRSGVRQQEPSVD